MPWGRWRLSIREPLAHRQPRNRGGDPRRTHAVLHLDLRALASRGARGAPCGAQRPVVDDALHHDRRRDAADTGKRSQLLVVEALVGAHVGGDDAEQVVGLAEEPLGVDDLGQRGGARSGRAPAAPERPPLTTAPPRQSRRLSAIDRALGGVQTRSATASTRGACFCTKPAVSTGPLGLGLERCLAHRSLRCGGHLHARASPRWRANASPYTGSAVSTVLGGWRPYGVPLVVASRRRWRFAPQRCPMNARSAWLGLTREALVMMGSGVRVPPSASSGSPMDRGLSAAARRRRRRLLASVWRPVCPSQSNGLDSGRHGISAGDRVKPDRRRRRPNHKSSLARAARSVLPQPARDVEWPLRRRIEDGASWFAPCSSTHAGARAERTARLRTTGTRPLQQPARRRPRRLPSGGASTAQTPPIRRKRQPSANGSHIPLRRG
jgi:hypothetical protein